MVQTYSALEGDLSVRSTDTAARSGAANAVAIVGGYDASTAASDVTAGEATKITNASTASEDFGESEISRAAKAVSANGAGTIYGVPVSETESTETFGSSTATSSGTLSNTPIFDPNVHPEHTITITDITEGVDLDVSYVYGETPSQPSTSNAARINPITGEWAADTSSEYDFTYTYGSYSAAITEACSLDVRYVVVGTEAPSVKTTLVTELNDVAKDFDFKRGVVGATPEIQDADIASYTPSSEDWRLVEVAPARASGADGTVRTAAAVTGLLASQPIGPDGSGLFDSINGVSSLNTSYRPSDISSVSQLLAITENGRVGKADTTSSERQFQPVYATEIIDNIALDLFDVAQEYAGGPQDVGDLETLLGTVLQSASTGNPPLLGFVDDRDSRPYDVSVSLADEQTTANAGVVIVPYPIAEEVNVSITVSDGFVEFDGVSA